jgi:hypothetical protein
MQGTTDRPDLTPGDDAPLDPREAQRMIAEAEGAIASRLRFDPPWLSLFGAVGIFAVYGALYMSTRDEHPYKGPHGLWLIMIPIVVLSALTLNVTVFKRVADTVSGPTARRRKWFGFVIAAALACVYTLNGALHQNGASNAIVYGVFDAAGPLVVLGCVGAADANHRDDYLTLWACLAIAAVATGAAFAGPHGVWGVIAVGGCLVLLARTAAKVAWDRGWRPTVNTEITGPGAHL